MVINPGRSITYKLEITDGGYLKNYLKDVTIEILKQYLQIKSSLKNPEKDFQQINVERLSRSSLYL